MTAIRWMLRRRSLFAAVIAAVAIAGLLAMHGMDAGSPGGHAMAMPAAADAPVAALTRTVSHDTPHAQPASRVFRDVPAGAGESVSHDTPHAQPAPRVFWDMPAGAGDSAGEGTGEGAGDLAAHGGAHSGPMCALAPAPAHAMPVPAATATLVAAPAVDASVVAPVESRALDPPTLTALGVCRR